MALLFSNTVAEAADWLTETTGELWTACRLLEAMLFAGAEVQAITPVDAQFGLYEWDRNDGATPHSFIRRRSIARPSLVSLHRVHVAQLLERGETWIHLAEPPRDGDQDDVCGGTLQMIDQHVLATEDRHECDGYVFVEPWLTALKIDLSMIRLAATDLRELLATVAQLTSKKETNPSAPYPSNVPSTQADPQTPEPTVCSAPDASPISKQRAPDAFVRALRHLISEISRRAAEQELPFDAREMPGTKADLQQLAERFGEGFGHYRPRTFDDYLSGLVQFKRGARPSDFYSRLFPEFFQ